MSSTTLCEARKKNFDPASLKVEVTHKGKNFKKIAPGLTQHERQRVDTPYMVTGRGRKSVDLEIDQQVFSRFGCGKVIG
jgi:hypothetical protein